MNLPEECSRLRIYIGEDDRYNGPKPMYINRPRYEIIVAEARRCGLAGATAFKGIMSFGANSRVHAALAGTDLRLSRDLPILIDIVDTNEKIDDFVKRLDDLVGEGLVTREPVHVVSYRAKKTQA